MELMNTCLFYVGQVWDPFTLESLRQLDNNGSNQAITAMTALPGPSTMIVTATNEAMLRSGHYSILWFHSLKLIQLSNTVVECHDTCYISTSFSIGTWI